MNPRKATVVTTYTTDTNTFTFKDLNVKSRFFYRVRTRGEENIYSQWSKEKGFTFSGNASEGDVNGDGDVNVADVDSVIEAIGEDYETNKAADINGDGDINVADVDFVIERIK
jgi:N-dimethylarginine dimethylaminohydrolase